MQSDKAQIRHLGEDRVSCPGKLKKKIAEAVQIEVESKSKGGSRP
jgi:hypothetical protein